MGALTVAAPNPHGWGRWRFDSSIGWPLGPFINGRQQHESTPPLLAETAPLPNAGAVAAAALGYAVPSGRDESKRVAAVYRDHCHAARRTTCRANCCAVFCMAPPLPSSPSCRVL